MPTAIVGIVAGNAQDWETLRGAAETLDRFQVPWQEWTLDELHPEAESRLAALRGQLRSSTIKVVIVGAAADATLPASIAGLTSVPTLAVPLADQPQNTLAALRGVADAVEQSPVAFLAVGKAGATNAALLAIAILARSDTALRDKLQNFREEQTAKVLADRLLS